MNPTEGKLAGNWEGPYREETCQEGARRAKDKEEHDDQTEKPPTDTIQTGSHKHEEEHPPAEETPLEETISLTLSPDNSATAATTSSTSGELSAPSKEETTGGPSGERAGRAEEAAAPGAALGEGEPGGPGSGSFPTPKRPHAAPRPPARQRGYPTQKCGRSIAQPDGSKIQPQPTSPLTHPLSEPCYFHISPCKTALGPPPPLQANQKSRIDRTGSISSSANPSLHSPEGHGGHGGGEKTTNTLRRPNAIRKTPPLLPNSSNNRLLRNYLPLLRRATNISTKITPLTRRRSGKITTKRRSGKITSRRRRAPKAQMLTRTRRSRRNRDRRTCSMKRGIPGILPKRRAKRPRSPSSSLRGTPQNPVPGQHQLHEDEERTESHLQSSNETSNS
ncbi:uncharacterized protein G2W53_004553 [Senna tora]|uniref:Uncharacterized protein n=1 Tax=Senna tora TaxID=362788 RepID=A0A834XD45_9FABA|nr:uncharacterized protein G2W53_004553 [Senna tora]